MLAIASTELCELVLVAICKCGADARRAIASQRPNGPTAPIGLSANGNKWPAGLKRFYILSRFTAKHPAFM